MGQSQDHALGRSRRAFAKAEASFGAQISLTATDALKTTKPFKFDAKVDRQNRVDNRATRDYLERITRLTTVKWDVESYLLPSGSAGTKPNIGTLLKIGLGTETVNGGVSVVYGLNNTQSMGSATISQYFNTPAGIFMETGIGCWVDEVQLKVSGKDEPRLTITGGAKAYAQTGTTLTVGAGAPGTNTLTITAGDAGTLMNGSVVAIGADTNSGAGYLVTAGGGTASLTISPACSAGYAGGVAVTPFTPSETTVGSPVSFTLGSATLDGGAIPITDFELHIKNNNKLITDEAFNVGVSDYLPGNREVSGKFTIRARKDQIVNWGKRWALATHAIVVNVGTIAGKKLAVSVPTAELEFVAANIPVDDAALFDFPFTGLGSSGEDSTTWTFT